jgi:hypothetical protein
MNSGRMSARLLSVAILIVVLRNVSCLHLARIQRGGVFVAVLSHISDGLLEPVQRCDEHFKSVSATPALLVTLSYVLSNVHSS